MLDETYNIKNDYPDDHREQEKIDNFIRKTKEKIKTNKECDNG